MSIEVWLTLAGTLITAAWLVFEVYKWRNGGK